MEQWLLPVAIILLKFVFKLFIDRQVDWPEIIMGLLAVPFDIAFLVSTFLTALIVLDTGHIDEGLGFLVISFVIAVFAVVLWRRSERSFERDKLGLTWALASSNFLVTGTAAYFAIRMLGKGALL
jgi:hypothetical protein